MVCMVYNILFQFYYVLVYEILVLVQVLVLEFELWELRLCMKIEPCSLEIIVYLENCTSLEKSSS